MKQTKPTATPDKKATAKKKSTLKKKGAVTGTATIDLWSNFIQLLGKDTRAEITDPQPGAPVPAAEAELCSFEFEKLVHRTSAEELKAKLTKAYSWSVAFTGKELSKWLADIVSKPSTVVDNVRIVFGIYTPGYASAHAAELPANSEGRLSVFLWPYLGNEEAREGKDADNRIKPYNLGGLEP